MPFVFKERRKTIFILPAMSHHILSNHHTSILFSVTQSAFFDFSVLKTSTATHPIIIYFQVVLRLSFRRFEFLWQRSSGVKNAHWSLAASIISVSTSTTLKSISGCLWLIVNFKWYYDCPFVVLLIVGTTKSKRSSVTTFCCWLLLEEDKQYLYLSVIGWLVDCCLGIDCRWSLVIVIAHNCLAGQVRWWSHWPID